MKIEGFWLGFTLMILLIIFFVDFEELLLSLAPRLLLSVLMVDFKQIIFHSFDLS